MTKINIITLAGALTLGLSISSSALAQTTLNVGTWLPPTHVQNATVWPTWASWVETATEGRVKVKLEYGLGHPKTMFDLVEDGVIDASYSYHGFVPGRFKLTQAVELPLLGTTAEAASVAHWRVFNKYFAKAEEHDGVEVLALFTHGPGQIHLANPITSLKDLASKKIRVGGGIQSEIGERLGITAVGAPGGKVYEMMQQGVVDGVFMPIAEQKTLRLSEVAPNVVALPTGMYLGSFSMFISPDFMDSLSAKDQAAIRSVSGEKLTAMAGAAWDTADKIGLQAAKDAGVNIMMLSQDDAITNEFKQLMTGIDESWYELVAKRGVDAKAALAQLREIARSYEPSNQ